MDKNTLEALLKKGYISKDTFEKGIQKFADGGAVPNPIITTAVPQFQQSPAAAPVEEQAFAQIPEPQLSAQPTERYTPPRADFNVPAEGYAGKKVKDEAAARAAYRSQFTPSPLMQAEENIASDIAKSAVQGIMPETRKMASEKPVVEQKQVQTKQPTQGEAYQKAYKGLAEGLDESFAQMEKGFTEAADIGAKQASAMSSAYTTALNDLQKWQKDQDAKQVDRQTALQKKADEYEEAIGKFEKTALIDPERYWNNKSTGQKVGMAIAVALGGVGGGTNQVMQMIDNNITRDIEAQKAEASKFKTAADLKNNIYSNMLAQFNSEVAATTATRLAKMSIIETQIRKQEAATNSLMVKANAQKMLGELGLKKAELQQNLLKQYQTSPAFMAYDSTMQKIRTLPENLQGKAYEELKDQEQHEKGVVVIGDALQTMFDNKARITPTQRQNYDAAKAIMLSNTSELFGGKSESEFENMAEGFASGRFATKEAFEKQKEMLFNKYKSLKSYPLLDRMGVTPKKISAQRID